MSLDISSANTWAMLQALDGTLARLPSAQSYLFGAAVTCMAVWVFIRWLPTSPQQPRTTRLRGPPSESFLFGVGKRIVDAEDPGAVYETWVQEYGPVYEVPSTLGSKKILLFDPKAMAHFYAKEPWAYTKTPFTEKALARLFGNSLVLARGEAHKRRRKFLAPAFGISAVRQLTSIFYDVVYKARGAWGVLIESSDGDGTIIDVQSWMNHVSLDTIGLAGFGHNFGALEGRYSCVAEVFDALAASSSSTALEKVVLLLGLVFPLLARVPTSRTRLFQKLNVALEEIANVFLTRTQKETEDAVGGEKERSIIGLLIKVSSGNSETRMTKDEIVCQIKQLLFAGYETTSVTLTWALLELARNPDVQRKLRNELLEHGPDPTYDELANGLPYLDAIVHEILRVHPATIEFIRVAIEDDVIPLSEPIRTTSGELADSLTIAKGTHVAVSVESVNRSDATWGDDAKVFRPDRWLQDAQGHNRIPSKAKEIQGHRHLLTFVDGPRMCLGKNFALTEVKTVLGVLVKNFVFELRDSSTDQIEIGRGIVPRPRIAGEVGFKVPLRVRPYVA